MDVDRLRADFPVLSRTINDMPIIYFDNACMTLKPRQVIDAVVDYYENYSACAGRSVHKLSMGVTNMMDESRESLQKLIGAKHPEEVIFTKNTTESINLAAHSIGLKKGDTVLTTDREHNSNLVPWHLLREEVGIKHKVVPSHDDNTFDLERFKEMFDTSVKLVSMVHTGNLDGVTIPEREIAEIAHDHDALFMLDGAQSVPHKPIDVESMGIDLLAWSVHKMVGPTGVGCLYGRKDILDDMRPFIGGGDTVELTTYEDSTFLKPPQKFEAGLQNYAGIIGAGAAAEYLMGIGLGDIEKREYELNKYISDGLKEIGGIEVLGPDDPAKRSGIINMVVDGVNPHDIAMTLDEGANIMTRSGTHCVHSWFQNRGIGGSIRASLYAYNTIDEAKVFLENLDEILSILRN